MATKVITVTLVVNTDLKPHYSAAGEPIGLVNDPGQVFRPGIYLEIETPKVFGDDSEYETLHEENFMAHGIEPVGFQESTVTDA